MAKLAAPQDRLGLSSKCGTAANRAPVTVNVHNPGRKQRGNRPAEHLARFAPRAVTGNAAAVDMSTRPSTSGTPRAGDLGKQGWERRPSLEVYALWLRARRAGFKSWFRLRKTAETGGKRRCGESHGDARRPLPGQSGWLVDRRMRDASGRSIAGGQSTRPCV
jgi:hypothetical protein